MGWGNHHASYDEPCTQESIYAWRMQRAEEASDQNDAIRDQDYKNLQRWYVESRDLTDKGATDLWYQYFPRYRIEGSYYGPKTPLIEDHWEKRLPPTPVEREVESPLWWAENKVRLVI